MLKIKFGNFTLRSVENRKLRLLKLRVKKTKPSLINSEIDLLKSFCPLSIWCEAEGRIYRVVFLGLQPLCLEANTGPPPAARPRPAAGPAGPQDGSQAFQPALKLNTKLCFFYFFTLNCPNAHPDVEPQFQRNSFRENRKKRFLHHQK